MLKAIFNVIFTVAFSFVFLILATFLTAMLFLLIFRDGTQAFYYSLFALPLLHPPIFLGSMLLSKLLLRMWRKGKFLFLSIPFQYVTLFAVFGLGFGLHEIDNNLMSETLMWILFWSVPLINFTIQFVLDRIEPIGNDPGPYNYDKIDLKTENKRISKRDLPAYYDGE